MYKVRMPARGKGKPATIRLGTEAEAREWAARTPGAKYVGPVVVVLGADGEWRELKQRR